METTFQDDLGADSPDVYQDHHGYRGRVRYRDPLQSLRRAGYYCRRSSRDDQERSELVKLEPCKNRGNDSGESLLATRGHSPVLYDVFRETGHTLTAIYE